MPPPDRSGGADPGPPLSQAPTRAGSPERQATSAGDPSAPLLAPGAAFGPYLVHRLLGRGGMGEVYEAEHLETGRRVALKVLGRALAETTDRARFLREGRLAASISHPHSVYVFGTEEIEGTPVISMELVVGGTLKDWLAREGPLPPGRAVDAILQVISGLEAAVERGVLHRDVKPSNCFVEADGTVKVGDFGLSMTTSALEGTQLTLTGSFLGTPSFASPEQLRGEPLDVRADIYSVGATLYCLLTGHAPFEDGGMVQVLAAVLQQPPRDPRTLRPGIPQGLARIILRCLAKDRAARYGGYEELRADLLSFASAAPSPASLGMRVVAGLIDGAVVAALFFAVTSLFLGTDWVALPLRERTIRSLPVNLLTLLYYAFLEGRWGAALGKAVCGLRVVGPDRGRAGIARALLRVSCFVLAPWTVWLAWVALDPATALPAAESRRQWAEPVVAFLGESLILLLFCTARPGNGYAALHDLVSGTRVVARPARAERLRVAAAEEALAAPEGDRRLGPYLVIRPLSSGGEPGLLAAYDDGLRRHTWILSSLPGAPRVSMDRRNLGRPARLRWLGDRRTASESWDAYEAPEGRALLDLRGQSQPWSAVRLWLTDLAEELRAGSADGTLPEVIGLDRVWITSQGRARLLDFRVPGAAGHEGPAVPVAGGRIDPAAAQTFLHAVAIVGIEGRLPPAGGARPAAPFVPLPVHARTLLESLARGAFASLESLASEQRALARNPAGISRGSRLLQITLCAAVPVLLTITSILTMSAFQATFARHPDLHLLRHCLRELQSYRQACPDLERGVADACADRRAMEVYIAGRLRGTLSDPTLWSDVFAATLLVPGARRIAEDLLARYAETPAPELAAAEARLRPFLEREGRGKAPSFPPAIGLAIFLSFAAIPAVLSAWVFRGGLLLRLLGQAVVRRDGAPVTRLRAFLRAFAAWSPALLLAFHFALVRVLPAIRPALPMVSLAVVLLFTLGALASVPDPSRGVQDRLAGTRIVPR